MFLKLQKSVGDDLGKWHNEETDPDKREALDTFKAKVTQRWTPAYFDTPEKLALEVVLALDDWEARGRPGARKTFASTRDFFARKNPARHFALLDFSTTLLGRDEQMKALHAFAADPTQRACILSGRGGIGKSKILHDWAVTQGDDVVFLKDEPFWYESSDKEIPVSCRTLIVDDAHRQDHLNKVLQLIHDAAQHRDLKLILSTRPGSATRLAQEVARRIDRSQVTEIPELKELTQNESRELAEQVLGPDFERYSPHLAEIGSNSPLVIVAGGRLIALRKIDPATLTTLDEFRSTIFTRLLSEMDLQGPQFQIEARKMLHLIAALGPVDVESRDFRQAAIRLFERPIDEVLATVDQLAVVGIVTPRPKPVRILPDILSDYLLEDRCISREGRTTRYADRVYELFGAHSLKNIMRNLAELDWRRGRDGETGLNLLDGIWADIFTRFRSGDEFEREKLLGELAGAAIYQPDEVMRLARLAIDNPVVVSSNTEGSFFRLGQEHVLAALPPLLEAIAHHPGKRRESVTNLWELAKRSAERSTSDKSAQSALRRLCAWHRYGDLSLNFSMLIEAIRLTRRADAFTGEFTPIELIARILEREGEFSEWQDERTLSIGGFELNYQAVSPVRENAIDFLEFALDQHEDLATRALAQLEVLLPYYLNRVGRSPTEDELEWQRRERERCLRIILKRIRRPASALFKARLYDAIRSATAIHRPDYIRSTAIAALAEFAVDDEVAVIDAICTADHDLPSLSAEVSESGWESSINEVMMRGRSGLERLLSGTGNQVSFTINKIEACLELRIKTGGFHRFMLIFRDRPDFLGEMADQLAIHPNVSQMSSQLSSVYAAIHLSEPPAFRDRALAALESGATQVIHAAACNLRVVESADEKDIAVIQAYAGYPDPVAKRGASFAIAYMGKFVELRQGLKEAALSIRTEGDGLVAVDLAEAFGPYGVQLTSLTRDEALKVALEFLPVRSWAFDQGTIFRFLGRLSGLFPDEVFELFLRRIDLSSKIKVDGSGSFLTFELGDCQAAFSNFPTEKRAPLGREALRLMTTEPAEELSDLFWNIVGVNETAFNLIMEIAPALENQGLAKLEVLVEKAPSRLVFTSISFVNQLLGLFSETQREKLVQVLAHQAYKPMRGVFHGTPEDHRAQREHRFRASVAALPDYPALEDLSRALRRFL